MKSSKQKEPATPALRFPEFSGSGEWQLKPLSNVLSYERPDKYIVKNTTYKKTGIPVLTANKSFILGYIEESHNVCEELPVILFDDFTTDKKYVDFPFSVKSSALKILRPREDNNLKFAFELLSTIKFEAKEHKRYYISEYQNIEVPMPHPSEQSHIAECLSSLDNVIESTIRKKEALVEYKKGLLQHLFPSKGSDIPTTGFPEFSETTVWSSKPLMELITTITPPLKIPTSNYLHNGKYPIIDQSANQIAGWTNDESAIVKGVSKENPIIVFGDHTCVLKLITFEFAQGADGIKILKPTGEVTAEYLYQYLLANPISDNEYKRHFSILKDLPVLYPKINSEEQQKIADCLLSVDKLITATSHKIDALKEFKSGLLQQLFPKI